MSDKLTWKLMVLGYAAWRVVTWPVRILTGSRPDQRETRYFEIPAGRFTKETMGEAATMARQPTYPTDPFLRAQKPEPKQKVRVPAARRLSMVENAWWASK